MSPAPSTQLAMSARDVPRRNRPGSVRLPRLDKLSCPPQKKPTTPSQSSSNGGNNTPTDAMRKTRDESDLLLSGNVFNFTDGKEWVTFNGDGNTDQAVNLTLSAAPRMEGSSQQSAGVVPESNNRDDVESARGEDNSRVAETSIVAVGDKNNISSNWAGFLHQKPDGGATEHPPISVLPPPSAPPAPTSPSSSSGAQSSDSSSRNASQRVAVSRRHGGVPRPPPAARPNNSSSTNSQSTSPPAPPSGTVSSRQGRSRAVRTDDANPVPVATGRRSRSLTPNGGELSIRRCSLSLTRRANPPVQQQPKAGRGRSNSRPRSRTPSDRSRRGRSSSRPRAPSENGHRARSSSRTRSDSLRRRSRSSSRGRVPSIDGATCSFSVNSHLRSFGTPRANAVITSRSTSNTSEFNQDMSVPELGQSSSFDNVTAQLANNGSAHENENHNASLRPSLASSSRREGGLMERLFGDVVPAEARHNFIPSNTRANTAPSVTSTSAGSTTAFDNVQPRTLLTASVYHNEATHLWIATINTNQKGLKATNKSNASKYLKAFSFHTEREARESAYANAPPKMHPFSESPNCALCNGKFAVFRRPCHCRNCGVCICSSCSKTWTSKMIPETYNMKNEKNIKVCKTCHLLHNKFQQALLDGNYDDAVSLFHTGNVNLRCQFSSVNSESSYPVHCAAEGGNIQLLQWLVDVHFCPIKRTGSSNRGKRSRKSSSSLLQTSKGRTVLDIAMTYQRVDILRYLVVEKGISIYDIKDLKISLGALEAVLNALPAPNDVDFPYLERDYTGRGLSDEEERAIMTEAMGSDSLDMVPTPRDCEHKSFDLGTPSKESNTVQDACILCYENTIDCVITPCGHQICCLQCSENLSTCPVCSVQCQFIKIFKP